MDMHFNMKKFLNFIPSILIMLIFIVWTILVKTIDASYIYGVGYLGFSHINFQINDYIVNTFARCDTANLISDIGLYLSFVVVLAFATIGVVQLIKRKSLKKVDPILYVLLATYVISVIFYIIFEINKINYSPKSTYYDLKASYPSSHVLFFTSFVVTGVIALFEYVNVNKIIKIISISVASIVSICYAVLRLFSGEHYFSDIIGAIFLSLVVIAIFVALKRIFVNKIKESE